jgi:hypothetical protein
LFYQNVAKRQRLPKTPKKPEIQRSLYNHEIQTSTDIGQPEQSIAELLTKNSGAAKKAAKAMSNSSTIARLAFLTRA